MENILTIKQAAEYIEDFICLLITADQQKLYQKLLSENQPLESFILVYRKEVNQLIQKLCAVYDQPLNIRKTVFNNSPAIVQALLYQRFVFIAAFFEDLPDTAFPLPKAPPLFLSHLLMDFYECKNPLIFG